MSMRILAITRDQVDCKATGVDWKALEEPLQKDAELLHWFRQKQERNKAAKERAKRRKAAQREQ